MEMRRKRRGRESEQFSSNSGRNDKRYELRKISDG